MKPHACLTITGALIVLALGETPAQGFDGSHAQADSLTRLAHRTYDPADLASVRKAVSLWLAAAGLSHGISADTDEVENLQNAALGYNVLGLRDSVLALLAQGLAVAGATGNRRILARVLAARGHFQLFWGDTSTGEATFSDAIQAYRDAADPYGESALWGFLTRLHLRRHEFAMALRDHEANLRLIPPQDSAFLRSDLAAALDSLPWDHLKTGQPPDQVWPLARLVELGGIPELGALLLEDVMHRPRMDKGGVDTAALFGREAARMASVPGVRSATRARILLSLSVLLHTLGDVDSALAAARSAYSLLRVNGGPAERAEVLTEIADLHDALGQLDSALLYSQQALLLAKQAGTAETLIQTLSSQGSLYFNIGRLDSAASVQEEALRLARKFGSSVPATYFQLEVGATYEQLGRHEDALRAYRQVLAMPDTPIDSASALKGILAIHRVEGRADSVEASLQLLEAMAAKSSTRDARLYGAVGAGYSLIMLGQTQRALDVLRAADDLGVEADYSRSRVMVVLAMGLAYSRGQHPDSALPYVRRALQLARGSHALDESSLLSLVAQEEAATGRPDRIAVALAYFDSAAAVARIYQRQAGTDLNRMILAERGVRLFDRWVSARIRSGLDPDPESQALATLAIAERGRAQALLDLMRGASRRRAVATMREAIGADPVAEGRRLLQPLRTERAALLAYLVGKERVMVWWLSPGDSLRSVEQAISQDSLGRLVELLRTGLGADDARAVMAQETSRTVRDPDGSRTGAVKTAVPKGQTARVLEALAGILLPEPLVATLPPATELVIVPQGTTGLVPFATLPADSSGTPLGIRNPLRYVPALEVLGLGTGSPPAVGTPHKSMVIGNPWMPKVTVAGGRSVRLSRLPGAEVEARAIAARLGSTALSGGAATEGVLRRRMPEAGLVHFATHGLAYSDQERARQSFIALAPGEGMDGLLTVGEVLDDPALTLRAELVVLSACQTGLGDLKQAEGTVGFQRAFLARGARTVLVSLWSVNDAATALLMRRFYAHWLADPDRPFKSEALRRAQSDVRSRSEFRDPRFWAAFQLVGAR